MRGIIVLLLIIEDVEKPLLRHIVKDPVKVLRALVLLIRWFLVVLNLIRLVLIELVDLT